MLEFEGYLPNKPERAHLTISPPRYKCSGLPRPREASFVPLGNRKDIKIKIHHKLS